MGPSIKEVGNMEEEGSKIIGTCRWIKVEKPDDMGGGLKKREKLPTSFMDGPYTTHYWKYKKPTITPTH